MKKYLREIEASGLGLVIIGIVISWIWGDNYGMWPCATGLLLWLITFLYKAFHWNEYARENKKNIAIILIATFWLIIRMVLS